MAVNNLAFSPFQGESGTQNFLSAYAQSQQIAQQRDAAERNKVLAGRQDEQYEREKKMQAIDALGGALDGVQDGDAQGFERVKSWAVQNGLLDANEAQKYTVQNLPQIRAMSQQARAMIKERQAADMEAKKFDLDRRSTEANIRQSDAAAAASNRANRGGGAGGVLGPQFDDETKLRGEFIKGADEFVKVRDAFGRIQASASDPSAAGDLALIFSYMKILDPGSVVREQEFANAQNAAGVPDQIRNMYNKVLSGERLAPNQRQDFTGRATKLYQQQLSNFQKTRRIYEGLAGQYGFAPDRAAPDLSLGVTGDEGGPPPPPPSFTRGQGVFTDQPVQQAPAANGGWSIKRVQ